MSQLSLGFQALYIAVTAWTRLNGL